MKLLIVSATIFEIEKILENIKNGFEQNEEEGTFQKGSLEVFFCISGLGSLQSTYHIQKAIQYFQPDFAIQLGVAGSFKERIPIKKIVMVESEVLADLGAEDGNVFLDAFDLNLIHEGEFPFEHKMMTNPLEIYPFQKKWNLVKGITVNKTAGNLNTIEQRVSKYDPDIESMEGGAFHFVCLQEKIPFAQIRSISNIVELRNKGNWKMKEAILKLNNWFIEELNILADPHSK